MDSLEQIEKDILNCSLCELRAGATNPVPGFGNLGAKYFIIGEAPGKEEDNCGLPFIGLAGLKLKKLLELAKISMNDVYISNVCRCRLPSKKTPKKKEIKRCEEFLRRELALQTNLTSIIVVGATPANLFTDQGIAQLHGTQMEVDYCGKEYNVIFQYHPSAAVHNPRLWADILGDWEHFPTKVDANFLINEKLPVSIKDNLMALDTETDGKGGIGRWSVAYRDEQEKLCVTSYYGAKKGMSFPQEVIFHYAKYDLRELKENKMEVPEKYHDTLIAAYCLGLGKQLPKELQKTGSDMAGGLGLKYLIRRHLGMKQTTWKHVADHPEEQEEYNAKDSVGTYLLFEKWKQDLPKFYYNIDMPLLEVLMSMEDRGIEIDPEYLSEFAGELDIKLGTYTFPFNPNSPKQIGEYLYGTLKIKPWKFTATNQPSTDIEVLEQIGDPTIKKVLEYKSLFKEKATYIENYQRGMDFNNRIHCTVNQTSTSTGRLSCSKPNLQNVFKRGERVKIRKLFKAKEGHKIVRMDYEQLDFKALAAITQDQYLIDALNSGKKVHSITAEDMDLPYDVAKTVNFGVMFKEEPWTLARDLHITIDEARRFFARYFKKYPNIKKYQDEQEERVKETKCAIIPFTGRFHRIDAMYVDQALIRKEGVKEGINFPVQGTEAEVVKIGMIDLHYKHSLPMLLQVHDELLFEIEASQADAFSHWLKEYIPTIVEIGGVKFTVSVGYGDNWYEAMKNEF